MLRLVTLFAVTATALTDWTPVTRGRVLQWDLFDTPLEISVDSQAQSGHKIVLKLGNQNGETAGGIIIKLDSTRSIPMYRFEKCMNSSQTLRNYPIAQQKIFRISKVNRRGSADKAVKIECNGVVMVDVLPSADTCDQPDWETYWGRDVKKIHFDSTDSASDNYRPHGDWTAVRRNEWLQWPDISSTTPMDQSLGLEILTDAMLGSNKKIVVQLYDMNNQRAGTIKIRFSTTPKYSLKKCTNSYRSITGISSYLANRLARDEKVFTIRRYGKLENIIIECDGVQFLRFTPSDETCDKDDWQTYWLRTVNRMKFSQKDTASNGFRLRD